MAEQSSEQRVGVAQSPPLERLEELAERYPQAYVTVRRQNTRSGRFQAIGMYTIDTKELCDGRFEQRLKDSYGGGHYLVHVRDPQNTTVQLIEKGYYTDIDGPELHVSAGVQVAGAGNRGPGRMIGTPPGMSMPPMEAPSHLPGFVGYGDPAMGPPQVDPSQFMSQRPDEIAMHFNMRLETALAESKRENAEALRELQRELKEERAQRAKLEKERAEDRAHHERELLRAELDSLKRARETPAPQRPPIDLTALIGFASALVPVLQTMITARTSQADSTLKLQQENTRAQFDGLKEVLRAQSERSGGADKALDTLVKITPLLTPVIKLWFEERSPSKQAEAISAVTESSLSTLSMVANVMGQFAEQQPEAWWAPLAKQLIGGVQEMAQTMALQGQQRRPAISAPQAPRAVSNGAGHSNGHASPADQAAAVAQDIMNAPSVPSEFKTQRWAEIFAMIHNPTLDPADVASAIGKHIDYLADAQPNMLPAMFKNFHDESPSNRSPREYLAELLNALPIAEANPKWVDAVLEAFEQSYAGDGDQPGETEVKAEVVR